MVLPDSSSAPIDCVNWDQLVSETGFLALGRNRYHCAYVVYGDGTYYYAENGTTGVLDFGGPNNRGGISGTNATLVIEAAMGALTAGRTWKEKIALKGSFTITANIDLVSYLVLDMYGAEFTLGFNGHIFILSDESHIELLGGHFDGQKATYAADFWNAVAGTLMSHITIRDAVYHDFSGKGIFLFRCDNALIDGVVSYSNGQDGIYFEGTVAPDDPSQDISIINCICHSNGRKGFNHGYIRRINYVGCKAYNNSEDGWNIEGGTLAISNYYSEDVKLEGCHSYSNTWTGFRIQMGLRRITLIDCMAYDNTTSGCYIRGSDDAYTIYDIQLIGGQYYENTTNGIDVSAHGTQNLKILGVSAFNNDQGDTGNDGISISGVATMAEFLIDDVLAYDDQLVATQDRGIDFGVNDLTGQSLYVRSISGSGNTVGLFRGTGIDVPTIVVPFVDGNDPQDSGFLIDLGGEYARTYLVLPPEANEVQRIQIYARSVVLEADAMRLETVINGGADNEPFNTHVGSEANLPSTSSNFAANDVIYWTCDPAGVIALTGGDSVEIKVLHEVAGGADCATNAYFRTASIEYV